MASIALMAVGGAIGGAIGGAGEVFLGLTAAAIGGDIGGMIGASIDQKFIFPALFGGQQQQNGPRIEHIQIQSGNEGSPVNYCWGPKSRVAGTFLWLSNLKEATHEHSGGKGGGGGYATYTYSVDMAIAVCAGPISKIRKVWTDGKVLFDDTDIAKDTPGIVTVLSASSKTVSLPGKFAEAHVYFGTDTQIPDDLMESYLGAGSVPAFRGIAYIVFKDFQLADYGNRVPNLTFEVEEASTRNLATVIDDLCIRSGLVSTDYDTSKVTPCMDGYTVKGATSTVRCLEPLLLAYDILVQEVNGVITFFDRIYAEDVSVSESDLGAESGSRSSRLALSDKASYHLPREVNVSYIDPARDLQQGSQRQQRINTPLRNVQTVTIPVTLSATDARDIARRLLWRAWAERKKATLTLPPSYLNIAEGSNLQVPFNGQVYNIRVDQVDHGADFIVAISGTVQETSVLTDATGSEIGVSNFVPGQTYFPPQVVVVILDIAALRATDAVTPGYYVGICAKDSAKPWHGSAFYSSMDDTSFSLIETAGAQAYIGYPLSTLADGIVGVWDYESTVDVLLYEGQLSSVTNLECLNGSNRVVIGKEILGFRDATIIGSKMYKLSTLLRGLRDTETTHTGNETVAVLNQNLVWHGINFSAIGATRYVRGVPAGAAVANETSHIVKATGATMLPFAPCHIKGSRDSSNNLTIAWIRRSRAFGRILSAAGMPTLETETYSVDIMNGTAVVRTIPSSVTQTTYSAVDQTADGFVPGNLITLRAYQVSSIIGRGNYKEVTI